MGSIESPQRQRDCDDVGEFLASVPVEKREALYREWRDILLSDAPSPDQIKYHIGC